jgi:hypothetical protein
MLALGRALVMLALGRRGLVVLALGRRGVMLALGRRGFVVLALCRVFSFTFRPRGPAEHPENREEDDQTYALTLHGWGP